jgi:hypothetical protein
MLTDEEFLKRVLHRVQDLKGVKSGAAASAEGQVHA